MGVEVHSNAHKESKVLIMDNPFGQTNASHLLIPLMEMAKNNNTQIICFTGHNGESIYDRFDNIHVLKLMPSKLGGADYLVSEHAKGKIPDEISAFHILSTGNGQMEMLF